MIIRYRKRPVEVDTCRWDGDNEAELRCFTGGNFNKLAPEDRDRCDDPDATGEVFDRLHSTWVLVYTGDSIIRGVQGEFYPIRADVLDETYERVS